MCWLLMALTMLCETLSESSHEDNLRTICIFQSRDQCLQFREKGEVGCRVSGFNGTEWCRGDHRQRTDTAWLAPDSRQNWRWLCARYRVRRPSPNWRRSTVKHSPDSTRNETGYSPGFSGYVVWNQVETALEMWIACGAISISMVAPTVNQWASRCPTVVCACGMPI